MAFTSANRCAAEIAGITSPEFLNELGRRRIPVNYDVDDLSSDMDFAILSDRSFPGAAFDQGTADGSGHLYVADNGG